MRVVVVFGTRPEAVKLAPLVHEMKGRPEFETTVCLTAQHRHLLDQVLDVLQIESDYDLNLMQDEQSLFQVTTRCLLGLEEVFRKVRPDVVLVQGDTTTALAAA